MKTARDYKGFYWLPASALLLGFCASCVTKPAKAPAAIVQTIDRFHRPESVVFSQDGRTLFVGNCGSDLFGQDRSFVGMVKGNGAVSKLSIDATGRAKIDDLHFIDGLNSPLGLGVLPIATQHFPKGTLLVNQGNTLLVDEQGQPVTDARDLGTGVMFFDPDTGVQLGKIELGIGSRMATILGHAVLLPNSIAFDRHGNLYITDTAKGGGRQIPAQSMHPGLIRIVHSAIDRAAEAVSGNLQEGEVSFTAVSGVPNGVGYWEEDDAIYVVTMGGTPPEGTAIYRIPADSFPRADLPAPFRDDVGTADGIAFTPAGTIITSRFSGDLLAIKASGETFSLEIDSLVAPADHRLITLADGSSLLAVPEQARIEPEHWSQRVRFIRLAAGF